MSLFVGKATETSGPARGASARGTAVDRVWELLATALPAPSYRAKPRGKDARRARSRDLDVCGAAERGECFERWVGDQVLLFDDRGRRGLLRRARGRTLASQTLRRIVGEPALETEVSRRPFLVDGDAHRDTAGWADRRAVVVGASRLLVFHAVSLTASETPTSLSRLPLRKSRGEPSDGRAYGAIRTAVLLGHSRRTRFVARCRSTSRGKRPLLRPHPRSPREPARRIASALPHRPRTPRVPRIER